MAITSDRVDLSAISNVAKSVYNKASDTEAIKTASSLASMKPQKRKKSILDTVQQKAISSTGTDIIGVTEDDCDALSSMRSGNLGAGNNRNLNSGISTVDCTIPVTGSDIISVVLDKALSMVPALLLKKSPLNSSHEKKINSLISSTVKQSLRAININTSDPLCLLNNSKGGLSNGMSNIGFTVGSKNKIGNLLSNNGNCLNGTLSLTDGGLAMVGIAYAGTINVLSRMGVEHTVGFANEINDDPVKREHFYSGYKSSINGRDDANIENKLLLLDVFKKNTNDENQKKRELVMTLGTTDSTIKAISNSKKTSNSPISDYRYTTRALSSMDPNWNKDIDGNTNYSRMKGNKRMSALADSSLKSSNSESTDFTTGKVNKSVEDDMALNIMLMQQSKQDLFAMA